MIPLEICATIAGIFYLYYAVRERPLCWAFYIVSAIAYLPVFLNSGLYLYATFQLLFMLAGLAGLLLWSSESSIRRGIGRMSRSQHLAINVSSLICIACGMRMLSHPTGALNAFFDLALSIYTLATTFLTARKYLESWLYWFAINTVGIAASLYNQLYPTALFFLINLVFAVIGYREWRQEMKGQLYPDVR